MTVVDTSPPPIDMPAINIDLPVDLGTGAPAAAPRTISMSNVWNPSRRRAQIPPPGLEEYEDDDED